MQTSSFPKAMPNSEHAEKDRQREAQALARFKATEAALRIAAHLVRARPLMLNALGVDQTDVEELYRYFGISYERYEG